MSVVRRQVRTHRIILRVGVELCRGEASGVRSESGAERESEVSREVVRGMREGSGGNKDGVGLGNELVCGCVVLVWYRTTLRT